MDTESTESDVPMEDSPTIEEGEQSQTRDMDPDFGTSTSEATACQLGSSFNTAFPRTQQGEGPESPIFDLLAQWDGYHLYQLTKFYGNRLKEAIEERVEKLGSMLAKEKHFSEEENEKITELAEKGNRKESSTLFLRMVMEKGSWTQRLMWESFVKIRNDLPKLDRILKEIQEHDVQQQHKENLRAQTETLRVKTILVREKEQVFQLVNHYVDLTVISPLRDQRLVENELRKIGSDHEKDRQYYLRRELEKIQPDQLFHSSFSKSKCKYGNSAVVSGAAGIGKTTMLQKIVYDWATGKIYKQFQFVFIFKFRDFNSIDGRKTLTELTRDQYPYFGNLLREVWKNPKRLLFIFDGLDEFNDIINFADRQGDTEPQHTCTDPEFRCRVSDIVYSLIQNKLLPGCSVLVTTRPAALRLLEKAEISVWAEILGFVGEDRKKYFFRYFEDRMVAEAVSKHVEENKILYTMSYNPSYCLTLALVLCPSFKQGDREPQQVPKTISQLYSSYIYNILKNHGRHIESPRDELRRVGEMAFRGLSQRRVVFRDDDLNNYSLQTSQFLSGFLMELLEKKDSPWGVVYTFPHIIIQDFVAALARFLDPDAGDMLKFLTGAFNTSAERYDGAFNTSGELLTGAFNTSAGRYDRFLRFVVGLSSPETARGLQEFLGPFPHQTVCQVTDWVKEEVKRQSRSGWSESGKRLLNTLHLIFESQNPELVQTVLESVEEFSFRGMTLTPIDCEVLSQLIAHCDTIKTLDLSGCHIHCDGLQSLGTGLHKFQDLRLGVNDLGDSGVKLVSAALRNPECKIQKLELWGVGLKDSGVEDLVSPLSAIRSLTELNLSSNDLGDSGVKLVSAALRGRECKIMKLGLWFVNLTDSGAEELISILSTKLSLTELNLGLNLLTDRSVPALRRLILNLPDLKQIKLDGNGFSGTGKKKLWPLDSPRPEISVIL